MRKTQIDHDNRTVTTTSTSDGKTWSVVMHYAIDDQLILAALEWAIIRFNVRARSGDIKPTETHHFDAWGEPILSDDQLIAKLSPKAVAILRARFEAEQAAKATTETAPATATAKRK